MRGSLAGIGPRTRLRSDRMMTMIPFPVARGRRVFTWGATSNVARVRAQPPANAVVRGLVPA